MAQRRLLSVHPHPDDESIACGGVLARYVDDGAEVHVVTCTGGEAGENLAGIDLAGRSLPDVRRDEMAAAVRALGLTSHRYLGFRDSGMAGTADNEHPEAFVQADVDEAAGRLAGIIRQLRPQVVVSDDEKGTYGHPDHVRAHLVTRRAIELAAADDDPWEVARHVAFTYDRDRLLQMHRFLVDAGLASPFGDESAGRADLVFGTEPDNIAFRIDVAAWLERKRKAMAAHASQIAEDSFFLNIPEDLGSAAFGVEEFELVSGAPPSSVPADDLFEDLP